MSEEWMGNIGCTFSNKTFIWGGTNTPSRLSHILVSLSQSYSIENNENWLHIDDKCQMRNIGYTYSFMTFIWGGTNTLSRLSHIFVSLSQSCTIETNENWLHIDDKCQMKNIGYTSLIEIFIWGGTNKLSRLGNMFVNLLSQYSGI